MPFNWNLFPWTKFNDINLDWFLGQFKHTQDVMEHAEEAVETIGTYDARIAAAESHATTALQEAGDAVAEAADAKETAEGIAGTANQALTTAQSAVDTANRASNTASGAYETAGTALTTANGINAKAEQAISTANSATNAATAAASHADEAYDLALSTQVRMIDIEQGVTGSVPNFSAAVSATLQADNSHSSDIQGTMAYRVSTNKRFIQIWGRAEALIAASSPAAGTTYDVKFVIPDLNIEESREIESAGMTLEGSGTSLPITLNHIASIYEMRVRLQNEGTGLAVRLRGFHSVTAQHRSSYYIPPIIIQLADNTPEFDSD